MKTWGKWVAPVLAALAFVLVLIFLSRPSMGRATGMDSIVEWLAALAAIISAIAGALSALQKPKPPEPQQGLGIQPPLSGTHPIGSPPPQSHPGQQQPQQRK